MPSFRIDNIIPYSYRDSYRYYLPSNALFKNDGHTTLTTGNIQFIFLYVITAALLGCVSNIWLYILEYIGDNHRHLYDDDHLYFVYVCARNLMSSLLPLIYIQKFLIIRYNGQKVYLLIWFVLQMVMFNGIHCYIGYQFQRGTKIFVLTQQRNPFICHWINCESTDLFHFYTKVIYISTVPFCTISMVHLYQYLYQNCKSSAIKTDENQLQLYLISSSTKLESDNDDKTVGNSKEIRTYQVLCAHFLFGFVYCWVILLYYVFMMFDGKIVDNYYEYINVVLIISFAITKFIIKRIARRIDWYRNYYIHMMHNEDKRIPISLEYVMEFWLSVLYWSIQREYVVFDVPTIPQYIFVTFLHLGSECIVSIIRSSRKYFDITEAFIFRYGQNKCIGWLLHYWSSGSSFEQWRLRCESDMLLRFIAALTMGFTQGVFLSIWRPDSYQKYHHFTPEENDYYTATIYNAVSTFLEFIYYGSVILIDYKFLNCLFLRNFKDIWKKLQYKYLIFIFCVMSVSCWH